MDQVVMQKFKETIRYRIQRKLDQLPDDIANIIKNNFALSGGAIASLFHGEEVSDYDLYFLDHAVGSMDVILDMIKMTNFIKKYDADDSIQEKDYSGLWVSNADNNTYVTARAVTLPNKIQIIIGDTLSGFRKNFDFVHCLPYYVIRDDKLYISEKQFQCIKYKKLVIHSKMATYSRDQKYFNRGYHYGDPTVNAIAELV